MKRGIAAVLASLAFTHVSNAEPLIVGFERFHSANPTEAGGRLLYNELGCVNCHGGETGLPARRGPSLIKVTHRVEADWLRAFLANPSHERAGSTMPQLLHAHDVDAINAVVHYLGSLAPKKTPVIKASRHVNAERGKELFHKIGCVACHEPETNHSPGVANLNKSDFTYPPVEFPELEKKYSLGTLTEFVRDPLKTRADGRMPRFKLEAQDATDLAGYLLNFHGSNGELAERLKPFVPDKSIADQGRIIVASLRCAACHDLSKDVTTVPVPLQKAEGGCLSPYTQPGVPRYLLSKSHQEALIQFLSNRQQSSDAGEQAALTLEALNCTACHDRNGRGGPDSARSHHFVGDPNLGDTGRFPSPLTGIGRKLQPEWLAKVFTGEARVRPYLHTRMPNYGTATENLVELLKKVDYRPQTPLPRGDIEAGRKLLGTQGGVDCITCHRWKDRPSLGIQALDLSTLAHRIQPEWLHEYLVNPAVYRPGTLMPSFWPDGKAANTALLDGDTARQIASIYAFAKSGTGEPDGYPDIESGEFELTPLDRPIVQRAFMDGAGTHAILVGFPHGVHLAYDGLTARPALAWKGKFFDAYKTWFSRFPLFEKPIGEAVVRWPVEARLPDPDDTRRFLGYRIDKHGVPTFLSSINGVNTEERFEAFESGLRRIVRWDASALESLNIDHPDSVTVSEKTDAKPGKREFVYTWK